MGAIGTLSTGSSREPSAVDDSASGIYFSVLSSLGVHLPETAKILDFGCGDGGTVRALRARRYLNACGYDVGDGRTIVRDDRHQIKFGTLLDLRLPYDDNTFDLVISDQVFEHVQDQVRAFEELLRITKPGGHGLHIIPARYAPIEPHILVPFGGVFQHRWWYKLWASCGIRNRFQAGMSADETADHNAFFVSEATRYISTSCYRVIFREIGFQYRFAEQEFFDSHDRATMRAIGKLGSPAMRLYRCFRARIVYLHKPESS